MNVNKANAVATGNRLNALEIWLGYFIILCRKFALLLYAADGNVFSVFPDVDVAEIGE